MLKFRQIIMSDENQKKPEIPHRMSRIAFPNAKYGVYLAIIIIFIILLILYKDLIL
jgi:hypothetical protein